MPQAVIAATGLYTPPYSLSNAELVETFNAYVERFNASNADAIGAGERDWICPWIWAMRAVTTVTPSTVAPPSKTTGQISHRRQLPMAESENTRSSQAVVGEPRRHEGEAGR